VRLRESLGKKKQNRPSVICTLIYRYLLFGLFSTKTKYIGILCVVLFGLIQEFNIHLSPHHSTKKKKNRSRGKEGELNVERKVKLFQENKTKQNKKTKKNHTRTHTNNTKQKSRSNRAKFASPDKALLDRFTMSPSPSRGLPSTLGENTE